MFNYWIIGKNGLEVDPVQAGSYVSRQLGLEARKKRAGNAMAVFADAPAAVAKYNTELTNLEAKAGAAFVEYSEKASALGYSEEQSRNYATKRCADWLESEIELLDLQHPFAGNTDLMINAKLGASLFRDPSMRVEPNSSVPVDVQQQVPIRGQAIPGRGRAPGRSKKTKKGKK
jgi:hypothetical protein